MTVGDYASDPGQAPAASKGHGRRNAFVLAALALFLVTSLYAAVAMIIRIDHIFAPGNEGWVSKRLPFVVPGLDDRPPDAVAAEDDRINVLLIGIDRRPTENKDGDYRSDAISILSIHPYARRASLLAVPRDLWVQIPVSNGGTTEERINTAYELGTKINHKGGGPGLLMDTLRHNFGVELDYYVVIEFEGFVKAIDALGGIDIDIPDHVAYWHSIDDQPVNHRWFEIHPGKHHLNGDDALAYSRYRGDSDLYRVERQQRVLFAAIDQALELDVLGRAPSVWDKYNNAIKTNLSSFRVPGLAALIQGISSDRIQVHSLGDAVLDFRSAGGAQALRFVPDDGANIIGAAFRPPAVENERASVIVYDGARDPALLRRAGLHLQLQGIAKERLVLTDPPSGSSMDRPLLLYRPNARITAKFIARWLKLDKVMREASAEEAATMAADVVVVLAPDTDPPLIALPGTERGAPAALFRGATGSGAGGAVRPPASSIVPAVPPSRPSVPVVPPGGGSSGGIATATPAPNPVVTPQPTAAPPNPFGPTATPRAGG